MFNNNNDNNNDNNNTTTPTTTLALNGANRTFYNLFTAPHIVSKMYAQMARAQSCANHVQHIKLSRATCRVPRGTKGTAQLLSLTEFKSYFSFILLAEPLTDKGGEGTGAPGENP